METETVEMNKVINEIMGGFEDIVTVVDKIKAKNRRVIELRNETERLMKKKLEDSKRFSNSLAKMTRLSTISSGFLKDAADVIAKEGCEVLGVSRVGIWRFVETMNILESITYYNAFTGEHTVQKYFSLAAREKYHSLLHTERMIVMNDVNECSLITGSFEGYADLCAALDTPVCVDGKLFGVVCVEQYVCEKFDAGRKWTIEEQNYSSSLADLMALAISCFERRKAQFAADEANKSKSDFLAVMSHEMRTPLIVMSAYVQYAVAQIRESGANEQTLADLSIISDEATRLAEMADGTLKIFVSAETGAGSGTVAASVDVGAILSGIVKLLKPAASRNGTELSAEISSALPPISGDADAITQLVWNILQNAITHALCKTVTLTASALDETAPAAGVTVTVRDDGAGIEPEILPRIFERGVSVQKSGSGLGLTICRDIARWHGGDVNVKSEIGAGTEVTVTLRGNGGTRVGFNG